MFQSFHIIETASELIAKLVSLVIGGSKDSVPGFAKPCVPSFAKGIVSGFAKISVHGFVKGIVSGFAKPCVHGFAKGIVPGLAKISVPGFAKPCVSVLASFIILSSIPSCSSDSESDTPSEPTIAEAEMEIELKENTWTYVSLETGGVVAMVAFTDSVQQKALQGRTDWDIAYAPNGLMRTNGGSSGSGQAALAISPTDYPSTDILIPFGNLERDVNGIDVW